MFIRLTTGTGPIKQILRKFYASVAKFCVNSTLTFCSSPIKHFQRKFYAKSRVNFYAANSSVAFYAGVILLNFVKLGRNFQRSIIKLPDNSKQISPNRKTPHIW